MKDRRHCFDRFLTRLFPHDTTLLKAIKVDKIVGKAAQCIRNITIENYANLHNALRSNVKIQYLTNTANNYAI